MQNKRSSKSTDQGGPRKTARAKSESSPSRPEALSTRDRILTAARTLYAHQNYSNVRIADISAASGANTALVNYYFGSKDDLFLEIFRQSCAEVSRERVRALDDLLREQPSPDMLAIVQAWMAPVFEQIRRDGSRLILSHLLSLVFSSEVNEAIRTILRDAFQQVDARYADVMLRARPDLSRALLEWRMLAAIGMYSMILGHPELILLVREAPLSEPVAEIDVHAELLCNLVALLGAPASAIAGSAGVPAKQRRGRTKPRGPL